MHRIILAATAYILLTSAPVSAGEYSIFGFPCGLSICLGCNSKIHQHGPLFNYGPYYGYPPFEPYGPWNQYLQYGAASSYGYGYAAPTDYYQGAPSAPAGDCPTCRNGAPVIPPQMTPTTLPAYSHVGSYNPYYPASYAPQPVPSYGAPVVPVRYPMQGR